MVFYFVLLRNNVSFKLVYFKLKTLSVARVLKKLYISFVLGFYYHSQNGISTASFGFFLNPGKCNAFFH